MTFDGDVTLYDDGQCLTPDNPVIPRILRLMQAGTKIGIVTAAGYTEAKRYYERLYGLLDAIAASDLSPSLRQNLIVLGGESNYCFKFAADTPDLLKLVPRKEWLLDEMMLWSEADITELLDVAEASLRDTIRNLRMEASVVRKDRAVGIIPALGQRFCRETLEETVLTVQKILVWRDMGTACAVADLFRKCLRSDVACRSVLSMVTITDCTQSERVLTCIRRKRRLRRHWGQVLGRSRLPTYLRRHRRWQDATRWRPVPVGRSKRLQSPAGLYNGVDCEPDGNGATSR
jgi:hypothetical protein